MAESKTGIVLIKEFFSVEKKPVEMGELKALSAADREELSDAIAAQRGLTKRVEAGRTVYA